MFCGACETAKTWEQRCPPTSWRVRPRSASLLVGVGRGRIDQYLALEMSQRQLVDERMTQLVELPDGPDCHLDLVTDQWTTTDAHGEGLILYIFRDDPARLVVLRLIY